MTRLAKVAAEDWAPVLRALIEPDRMTPLEQGPMRVHAHSPAIAAAMARFFAAIHTESELSERLMELVRLRIAFHNQCRSCMAIRYARAAEDGVDEAAVCSLERPMEADNLSEAEKAAIRYGELLASDHLSIGDETYAALKAHFSDRQIVELGQWSAFCVGFGRLAASWNMIEELPAAFQANGGTPVAPWREESVLIRQ